MAGDLDELRKAYTVLDRQIAEFVSRARIACPTECGLCCENFVPEITRAEADFIAAGVDPPGFLDHMLGSRQPSSSACPFYDVIGHCRIYLVRPLVCRLFGFSATRDKHGDVRFRACIHMPVPPELHRAAGIDTGDFTVPPPEMSAYSARQGGERLAIHRAVAEALARKRLRDRLRAAENRGTGDDHPFPDSPPPDGSPLIPGGDRPAA